jgi:hypothetical protein
MAKEEEEECHVLGCYALQSGRNLNVFGRNVLSFACLIYSPTLKMEVVRSFETYVNFYDAVSSYRI